MQCLNCSAPLEGPFCAQCGQNAGTKRISWSSLGHEITQSLLYLDRGFFYTSKALFTRPGHSIRAYLAGERIRHFKPFAYLFFTSTLYALVFHWLKINTVWSDLMEGFRNGAQQEPSAATRNFENMLAWLSSHYAYSSLLMLPLRSLGSYWAFRSSGLSYLEHGVLNAFHTGQKSLLFVLLAPLGLLLPIDVFQNLTVLGSLVLFFWTYWQCFSNYSWKSRILRSLWGLLLYGFLLFATLLLVIFLGAIGNQLA